METLISSSSAPVMGEMAAIALPPQMAVPAVIRNDAFPATLSRLPKSRPKQHGAADADRRVKETGAAGMHHLLQIHAKSQGNDGGLQQQLGQRTALQAERMLDGEAESNSPSQRNGRRNNATGRKKKADEKDRSAVRIAWLPPETLSALLSGRPNRNTDEQ